MINKFFRCVFVISMVSQAAFSELPHNYQSLSAFEKESLLWNEILSSPWKSLPPLSGKGWGSILANLKSLTSLKTTFDHQSDTIPEERIKIIHTYGSVVRMLFLPADQTPFTGLLNEVNVVHGRFSLAGDPNKISFTPGVAMKFFISTRPSLNIVLMHSLEGQGDNKDFFANTFSNSIAPPKSMSLKILNFIFETARKPANDLPVSQLAEWHSNGTKVNDVFSPKRIILVPDQSVRNVIPQDTKEDFRVSLSKILPGTVLYQMFGFDENNNKVYMGKFISDSKFVSSKFGDKNLFFQHQR